MKRTASQKKTIDEVVLVKEHGGRKPSVALVYPNDYASAVSNLGFNAVYAFLKKKGFDCERFFYSKEMRAIESGRRLNDFDIVAFSISFEFDALNVLSILKASGIQTSLKKRNEAPLVIIGGALTFFNPNVFWSVADVIFHGELEGCEGFFDKLSELWQEGFRGQHLLERLNTFECLSLPSVSDKKNVEVVRLKNLDHSLAESSILSKQGAFGKRYLLEIERGCTRGCRFCVAGYVYRPARFMSLEEVKRRLEKALKYTKNVGLVAATVSDYPFLDELLEWLKERIESLSVSSLRLDSLTPHLIETLLALGDKEITLAPEAGTQRMRDVIYKNISDDDIARAIRYVKSAGLKRVKLYFMYGLPTEKEEDLNGIIEIVKEVKRNGITPYISLNPFIPKPWTPFESFQMLSIKELKEKKRYLESDFRKLRVRYKFESVRLSRYQWVVSTATKDLSFILAESEKPADILKEVERNWKSNVEEWKYVNAVSDTFFALQKGLCLNLNGLNNKIDVQGKK